MRLLFALIAVLLFAPIAGAQTTIVVNQADVPNNSSAMWRCAQPISQLATNGLPLTIDLRYSGTWTGKTATGTPSNQGFGFFITSGCFGDGVDSSQDLIFRDNADGVTRGPNEDAIRMANSTNYGDFSISGEIHCGPRVIGSTHQDGVQILGGRNIDFIDFEVGDYAEGRPTCQGAGGAMFYSAGSVSGGVWGQDVRVLGGQYIGCNHALLAGYGTNGEVRDADFRSGYAPGDPKCNESGGYAVSNPCVFDSTWNGTSSNLVCDRFPFEGEPPPPPPPAACANGLDDDSDGLVDMADPGCESTLDNDEFNEPPPPPTCDQACVDAYEAEIADLEAQVAALEAEVADLEGRLSAALAERDRLGSIIDRAAVVLSEK